MDVSQDSVTKKFKVLRIKGITTKISDNVERSKDGRYYKITHDIADKIIAQDVSNIPVLFLHLTKFKIGKVLQFNKGKNDQDDVLECVFEITDQNFLTFLKKTAFLRYNTLYPTSYVTPDNFLDEENTSSSNEPIIVDAHLILTHKFSGLSLSHDKKTDSVVELSICLAGARDLSIIKEVKVIEKEENPHGSDPPPHSTEEYSNLIAALLGYDNYISTQKVIQDLTELKDKNKRLDCLVYSLMHKVPQFKDSKTQNMEQNDKSGEEVLQSILSKMEDIKNQLKEKKERNNTMQTGQKRKRDEDHYNTDSDCRSNFVHCNEPKRLKTLDGVSNSVCPCCVKKNELKKISSPPNDHHQHYQQQQLPPLYLELLEKTGLYPHLNNTSSYQLKHDILSSQNGPQLDLVSTPQQTHQSLPVVLGIHDTKWNGNIIQPSGTNQYQINPIPSNYVVTQPNGVNCQNNPVTTHVLLSNPITSQNNSTMMTMTPTSATTATAPEQTTLQHQEQAMLSLRHNNNNNNIFKQNTSNESSVVHPNTTQDIHWKQQQQSNTQTQCETQMKPMETDDYETECNADTDQKKIVSNNVNNDNSNFFVQEHNYALRSKSNAKRPTMMDYIQSAEKNLIIE